MKAKILNLKKSYVGKNFTMIDNTLINEHMNNLNLRELKVLLFLTYYNPTEDIKLTKPVLCKGTNQLKDDLNKTLKSLSEKGFIQIEGVNITLMPFNKVKSIPKSEGKKHSYQFSENSNEGNLPSYIEGNLPSYIEGENMPETPINKDITEVENPAYNTNINKTKENNTKENTYIESNIHSIIGVDNLDLDSKKFNHIPSKEDLIKEVNTSNKEIELNPSNLKDEVKEGINTSIVNNNSNLSPTGLNSHTFNGKYNYEFLYENSLKFNSIVNTSGIFQEVKKDYFSTSTITSIIQDINEVNPIKFNEEKQKILDLYRLTENDYIYLKYLVKYSIYMHRDYEKGISILDNPLGKSLSNVDNINKFLQDAA